MLKAWRDCSAEQGVLSAFRKGVTGLVFGFVGRHQYFKLNAGSCKRSQWKAHRDSVWEDSGRLKTSCAAFCVLGWCQRLNSVWTVTCSSTVLLVM